MAYAAAAAAAALARSSSVPSLTRPRVRSRSVFKPLATPSFSSSSLSSTSTPSRRLVLYSKPGCCLCDGLKEKLQAAFLLEGPDSLHDVDLQIRDITSNPEWERAYQYEIPVLARIHSDGTEELVRTQKILQQPENWTWRLPKTVNSFHYDYFGALWNILNR